MAKVVKKNIKKATIKKVTKVDVKASISTILERISNGESLRSILPSKNRPIELPHIGTFIDWVNADKDLAERYARAQELRAELLFEEILTIADDSSQDIIKNDKGVEFENKEFVNRSRLRVDARKWALSKMLPKKYGDKLDVTSEGKELKGNAIIMVNGAPINAPVTDEKDIGE